MDKNNYLPAVIVFCLTLLVLSAGYVYLNNNKPVPVPTPPPIVQQQPQQPRQYTHNIIKIIISGWVIAMDGPIYQDGYQLGRNERAHQHNHYYNDHCPDSFKLKLPKFQLEIR